MATIVSSLLMTLGELIQAMLSSVFQTEKGAVTVVQIGLESGTFQMDLWFPERAMPQYSIGTGQMMEPSISIVLMMLSCLQLDDTVARYLMLILSFRLYVHILVSAYLIY